ncbi:MAG: chloride channel protein [Planctomycetota bacterium]|nr:chloride channel protein [Planctomycetota bacterium]
MLPALLGGVIGLCVSGLIWFFEGQVLGSLVTSTSPSIVWITLAALPLSVLAMRFVAGTLSPSTNELYILRANDTRKSMPLRELPGRVLAGAVTVACGGAQGQESPSASLGAGLGNAFERLMGRHFPERLRGFFMMAGASAGLSAIFSSPGVGALYGLEIPFRRGFDARPLVQSVVAALAAFTVRSVTVGARPLVPFAEQHVSVDAPLIGGALLLALACGIGAKIFAGVANRARSLRQRASPWLGVSLGGLLLVVLGYIGWRATGAWVTLGPGHVMFDWATAAPQSVWLLLAALLLHASATIVCVFGGGGGGVFTSLTATGAMLGCVAAVLLDTPADFYLPLVGGACLLGAAYRIPLASIMMIVEWGGGWSSAVLGVICVVMAQACMGSGTIAPAQSEGPAQLLGTKE